MEEIFGSSAEVGHANGRGENEESPAKRAKLSPGISACSSGRSTHRGPLPSQCGDITHFLDESCQPPCSRHDTPPLPEKCSVFLRCGNAIENCILPICEARTQSLSPAAEKLEQSSAEEAPAFLAKLQSDLLAPKLYTVRPVANSPDAATKEYVDLAELTPKSLKSLVDTFATMEERHKVGRCAKSPSKLTVKACA